MDDDNYDEDMDESNDELESHGGIIKLTDKENGNEFFLSEYTISYEPMSDPKFEKFIMEVGESKMEELHHLTFKRPQKAIVVLKQKIAEHPNVPTLYNYLGVALESCQLRNEASRLVKETYEKFPDYFFGKINYLSCLIKEGNTDEVAKILNNKFEVKLQHPERNVFHISEVTGFIVMVVSYFIAINKIDVAQSHFNALKSIEPKHPHINRLELEFTAARLKNLLVPTS